MSHDHRGRHSSFFCPYTPDTGSGERGGGEEGERKGGEKKGVEKGVVLVYCIQNDLDIM